MTLRNVEPPSAPKQVPAGTYDAHVEWAEVDGERLVVTLSVEVDGQHLKVRDRVPLGVTWRLGMIYAALGLPIPSEVDDEAMAVEIRDRPVRIAVRISKDPRFRDVRWLLPDGYEPPPAGGSAPAAVTDCEVPF